MVQDRKPYPSDVGDEEWSLVVPYLTLMNEDAPQREHPLRELFNGLRYLIRYGIAWRAMPNDLESMQNPGGRHAAADRA
jgi:transposase